MTPPTPINISSGKLAGPIPSGSTINVSGSGVEIAGLTLNDVTINLDCTGATPGAGCWIHGCTFTGSLNLYFEFPVSGVAMVWNDFAPVNAFSVNGYPGNNHLIEFNKVDLTGIPVASDWASTNGGQEWMHLQAPCSYLTVRNNTFKAGIARWIMEFQTGMTHLTIADNYVEQQLGNFISCATGGNPTAPYAAQGEHITITGNVGVSAALGQVPLGDGGGVGVEIMGDLDIVISNNFFSGYNAGILNGTGGEMNQPLTSSGNTFICGGVIDNGDDTPWPVPTPICPSPTDKVYKPGAAGNPSPPATPANVGAAFDPGTLPGVTTTTNTTSTTTGGSTVTAPATNAPINLPVTLSSTGGGELTVSWTPPAGVAIAPTVSIVPTNGAASMAVPATGLTPASTTAAFADIPAGWKVTATVAYGTQYQGSATMQVSGGPAPSSNTSWPAAFIPPPAPPIAPPPPAKTVTHTIATVIDGTAVSSTLVYSDGSIATSA